ncbi:hypothetical protein EXIGLDRAFT_847025 [Exidia glandulosa HHB12029]|uniref:Uncharacterized protein n=1 Tax=Exidia glandulosa HHB12029 TaxID=1314781 RepID=A0A166NAI8_EXIGL|nr:hypothetical protein EXIGLDRAFT_847025 [Exidia glandulosa HHB12029]
MTASARPRLPPELILLIVEYAAPSEVFSRPSWVAQLCLVCRVFRRVVTPILYDHVAVDDYTYESLATTASLPDTPLAHTRSVYFVSKEPDKVYSQASFEWLARALANVSTFTGPTRALYELLERVDELTLSSAYITDITLSGNIVHITDVQPVIQTLSSLHLIYEFCPEDLNQQPDLSSSHVEYLAIDMYSNLDVLDEDPLDLTPMTRLATSPPRLRRILCRPRFVQESDVQSAAQAIVAWATSQRDKRVHIDDTFVRVGDTRSGWLWNKLDRQDAIDGNSTQKLPAEGRKFRPVLLPPAPWLPPSSSLYRLAVLQHPSFDIEVRIFYLVDAGEVHVRVAHVRKRSSGGSKAVHRRALARRRPRPLLLSSFGLLQDGFHIFRWPALIAYARNVKLPSATAKPPFPVRMPRTFQDPLECQSRQGRDATSRDAVICELCTIREHIVFRGADKLVNNTSRGYGMYADRLRIQHPDE